MVKRRLDSGLDVFQATNNIWAMDIMQDNIFESHSRIFAIIKDHLVANGLKLSRNDSIKLIGIVENNIFLVKDSIAEIKDSFEGMRFFDRDPTGNKFIMARPERVAKATDINERIKRGGDTNAFACLFNK